MKDLKFERCSIYVAWESKSAETQERAVGVSVYAQWEEYQKDFAKRIDYAASCAVGLGATMIFRTDIDGRPQAMSLKNFNNEVSLEFDKLYPTTDEAKTYPIVEVEL